MSEPLLATLPPGRHGLSPEFIRDNRRTRLLAGLTVALVEKPWSELTVADIVREAHVSRGTFYEHFDNKEELMEALVGFAFYQFNQAVCDAEDKLGAAVDFVEAHRDVAFVVLVRGPEAAPATYYGELKEVGWTRESGRDIYIANGVAGVFREWLSEGSDEWQGLKDLLRKWVVCE